MTSEFSKKEAYNIKSFLNSNLDENYILGLHLLEGFNFLPEKVINFIIKCKKKSPYFNSSPLKIKYTNNQIELFLNLKKLKLKALPKEIGQVKNLVEITISQAYLSEIPSEIQNLKNLKKLDIKDSPDISNKSLQNISKINSLKTLDLVCCGLNKFPSEILQLSNLEVLYLSENHIDSIPKEIKSMKKLFYLGLSKNRLNTVPLELLLLEKLEYLDLEENPLLETQRTTLKKYNKNRIIKF